MAAQKGSLVLIKADVGGTQTTIGGLRSSSITLSDEMVDVTTKDSSGSRELLPQGGNVSVTVSGSGIFTDSASESAVRGYFASGTLKTYSFIVPDLGTYSGSFMISSLEFAGEFNGEATYSITLESSGTVSFSAA